MALDPLHLGVLVLVGIIAGFLNVMAGGGSMLVLPIMVFMGIPGNIANGTNRIAMMAQNVTAAATFYKKGISNFKLSASLAICALPGAIFGAYLGTQIEGKSFNQILAVVMIAVMVMMIFDSKKQTTQAEVSKKRIIAGHVLMLFAGFWGGFIMAGVGFILIAIMNRVMGINLVSTNAHKVFIEIVFTVFALAIFASQLQLLWIAGLFLGAGNAIGGWIGANYQMKKGAGSVRKVLYVVLTVFIIKLLFFSN
jgi:uncharacterized membrane protein YfcA